MLACLSAETKRSMLASMDIWCSQCDPEFIWKVPVHLIGQKLVHSSGWYFVECLICAKY